MNRQTPLALATFLTLICFYASPSSASLDEPEHSGDEEYSAPPKPLSLTPAMTVYEFDQHLDSLKTLCQSHGIDPEKTKAILKASFSANRMKSALWSNQASFNIANTNRAYRDYYKIQVQNLRILSKKLQDWASNLYQQACQAPKGKSALNQDMLRLIQSTIPVDQISGSADAYAQLDSRSTPMSHPVLMWFTWRLDSWSQQVAFSNMLDKHLHIKQSSPMIKQKFENLKGFLKTNYIPHNPESTLSDVEDLLEKLNKDNIYTSLDTVLERMGVPFREDDQTTEFLPIFQKLVDSFALDSLQTKDVNFFEDLSQWAEKEHQHIIQRTPTNESVDQEKEDSATAFKDLVSQWDSFKKTLPWMIYQDLSQLIKDYQSSQIPLIPNQSIVGKLKRHLR